MAPKPRITKQMAKGINFLTHDFPGCCSARIISGLGLVTVVNETFSKAPFKRAVTSYAKLRHHQGQTLEEIHYCYAFLADLNQRYSNSTGYRTYKTKTFFICDRTSSMEKGDYARLYLRNSRVMELLKRQRRVKGFRITDSGEISGAHGGFVTGYILSIDEPLVMKESLDKAFKKLKARHDKYRAAPPKPSSIIADYWAVQEV